MTTTLNSMTAESSPHPQDAFTQTVHRLSGLLDTHLHGKEAGGARHDQWQDCFCATLLALNPESKLTDMLEALPPQSKGMDQTVLLNAMVNMGHYARSVGTTARLFDGRLAPCLFVPARPDIPPYIIINTNGQTVTIFDPVARRLRTLPASHPRVNRLGRSFFFQTFDRNRQAISKFIRGGSKQSWFRALLGRFTPTLRQIFFIGLGLNIAALAPPVYMMAVYDRVVSPSDAFSLWALASGITIALLAEYAFRRTRSDALSWLSARLDNLVGNEIFAHLLGLPPTVGEKVSVAAQIARIKTFESIRDLFSGAIFLSFLEVPYVLISLGLMMVIAGPLVIVPVLGIIAFLGLFAYYHRRIRTVIRLAAKASSARQQFTLESFEKLEGIHASGLQTAWEDRYADLTGREIMMTFRLAWLGTIAENVAQALLLSGVVMTIAYGVQLVWDGALSTGGLIASMMLVWRGLTPFYSLCAMVTRLEQLKNSIIQVNDLMDIESEAEAGQSSARLADIRGEIELSQVTMYYHHESDSVLKDASLHIAPGEIVGLTGRNGSGKSTVLKLIKGLYRNQGGAVRIDGFDIRQLDPTPLRRHIGYVGQQSDLFSGTVIENLRFARPLASEEEVRQALVLADAWEEVSHLDGGLNALISPARVSEALAARLSLARGYLHGGSILLIDELPTAILQGKAGYYLKRFLQRTRGKRTVIFISQQQDMLELADSVVEIVGGRLDYLKRSSPQRTATEEAVISYFTPRKETA